MTTSRHSPPRKPARRRTPSRRDLAFSSDRCSARLASSVYAQSRWTIDVSNRYCARSTWAAVPTPWPRCSGARRMPTSQTQPFRPKSSGSRHDVAGRRAVGQRDNEVVRVPGQEAVFLPSAPQRLPRREAAPLERLGEGRLRRAPLQQHEVTLLERAQRHVNCGRHPHLRLAPVIARKGVDEHQAWPDHGLTGNGTGPPPAQIPVFGNAIGERAVA